MRSTYMSAILAVCCAFTTAAQTYPTGQYPQYPPGQYPSTDYPSGQYPARLPGGIGVGIPVPEIKLPRRGEKTDKKQGDKEITITLKSIQGTLRQLGEKDMLVENREKGVVKFRVLARTQFQNKEGEPVRDSLLKPGDQLKVSVNADDEETALRVTLLRTGTPAERASASKPVDLASVKTPEGLSADPSQPALKDAHAAGEPEADERPKLQRKEPNAREHELPKQGGVYEGKTVSGDDSLLFDKADPIIEAAREAAGSFRETLPNFVVNQVTTRYVSTTRPAQWRAIDVITAEVSCVEGIEEYRNIAVNGRPASRPVEKTGAWSRGEFVTVLEHVLSRVTNASFLKRAEDRIGQRPAHLYDYTVKQHNSQWDIHAPSGPSYTPAFEGSIWVDKETHRVLRVEMRTNSLPSNFSYANVELVLDYDFVRIDAKSFLMPVHSENLTCSRNSYTCSRNVIDFRNYRKFGAESSIQYETKLVSKPAR
ncbi:MAG TPA: hypothetical protein VER03_15030 [Bryobacteraceae bacterium]|nr:hypothetical protein [Bryobacteraceae bacterium]